MIPDESAHAAAQAVLQHPGAQLQTEVRHLSEIALIGVYEISKILATPSRLETTLSNVLNLLSSFLDMQYGTIVLLDDDDVPEVVVGTCWSEDDAARMGPLVPQKALDQIVATGMPLVLQNAAQNPLFADVCARERHGAAFSFIGVPIRFDSKVVGTMSIERVWDAKSILRFDHDVRFLAMIANLIGQTIKLHRVISRDRERLMEESRRLEKQLTSDKPVAREKDGAKSKVRVSGILGESQPIRRLLDKIAIVAKSNATVLLRGESGTGKELFARAIHELSTRSAGPFVKVNCAALPESVLESELFGHEKGAFTGAISARKGRFEMADGGTLFLDEIGEISASFQAKLLRVLQEGEFDRVGSSKTTKVDVRIVAATNRDLEEAVTKGDFRADLYYRISVVPLLLPALRDRKSDIPVLAQSFLDRFNKENHRSLSLTTEAVEVLRACYFPGNVRELENCVCRTATLAQGEDILAADFACGRGECLSATLWRARTGATPHKSAGQFVPLPIVPSPQRSANGAVARGPVAGGDAGGAASPHHCTCGATNASDCVCVPADGGALSDDVSRISREKLVDAMERCGWVQAKAARILGITPRQIGYALRKHNVEIKKF